ncbi:MAG: hypothetical protein WDA75_21325 [Candidatus Latescibacterota bacterium]|jgi:hypothetical protein
MKSKVLVSCLAVCLWSAPGFAANLTAQTNEQDGRLTELRALAEVLLVETQGGPAVVEEGEELIVRRGGRRAVAAPVDQGYLREALSRLGEGLELDEIPEMLREIRQAEQEDFAALADQFGILTAAEAVAREDAETFAKSAERFQAVLRLDQMLLEAAALKVDRARAEGDVGPAAMSRMQSYTKAIADTRMRTERIRMEITRMARVEFRILDSPSEIAEEIGTQLAAIWADVEGIVRERSANPTGQSADWLQDARDRLNAALSSLNGLSERVTGLRSEYPADLAIQTLEKSIADHQQQIRSLLAGLEGGPKQE